MVPEDGNVVVLSTHLDDAAFSLGAWIHGLARRGRSALVVTVLGCDPASPRPAGSWDRRAGFATEGEAAATRRREDTAVWALLGARAEVLPFGDATYGRGGSDDEIWAAVDPFITDAGVVIAPGWPLAHEDHRWLFELARDRCDPHRLRLYREQPYASHQPDPCGDGAWTPLPAGPVDRWRKRRALRLYGSQLHLLGGRTTIRALARAERRCGGEALDAGSLG